MEKLKVDFEKEVKKYLSEDQQKGFEDYQEKQMSQRRKDRRPRQRG